MAIIRTATDIIAIATAIVMATATVTAQEQRLLELSEAILTCAGVTTAIALTEQATIHSSHTTVLVRRVALLIGDN